MVDVGMRLRGAHTFCRTEDCGAGVDGSALGLSCRVCFEDCVDKLELVSPCACTGTQRFVHLRCLRRWQDSVQKRNAADERAYRCSVCRSFFTIPPRSPLSVARTMRLLRGMGAVACIALLALGMSTPPLPQLALLCLLLLLGGRGGVSLSLALAALAAGVAALHARGLHLAMRMDPTGRLGLELVRHGAPVPGLEPGVLLVATEGLERSVFRRSVVLVTHSGRGGARGVMLTQPMTTPPPALVGSSWGAATNSSRRRFGPGRPETVIRHFLGGPVGMPGEGVRQELSMLHTVGAVPGAGRLLPWHSDSWQPAELPGAAVAQQRKQALYQGGSLADILEKGAPAPRSRFARAPPPPPPVAVHVFHGLCSWSEGQLEGEVRSGAWAFASGKVEDVLGVAPENLWPLLVNSDRLLFVE